MRRGTDGLPPHGPPYSPPCIRPARPSDLGPRGRTDAAAAAALDLLQRDPADVLVRGRAGGGLAGGAAATRRSRPSAAQLARERYTQLLQQQAPPDLLDLDSPVAAPGSPALAAPPGPGGAAGAPLAAAGSRAVPAAAGPLAPQSAASSDVFQGETVSARYAPDGRFYWARVVQAYMRQGASLVDVAWLRPHAGASEAEAAQYLIGQGRAATLDEAHYQNGLRVGVDVHRGAQPPAPAVGSVGPAPPAWAAAGSPAGGPDLGALAPDLLDLQAGPPESAQARDVAAAGLLGLQPAPALLGLQPVVLAPGAGHCGPSVPSGAPPPMAHSAANGFPAGVPAQPPSGGGLGAASGAVTFASAAPSASPAAAAAPAPGERFSFVADMLCEARTEAPLPPASAREAASGPTQSWSKDQLAKQRRAGNHMITVVAAIGGFVTKQGNLAAAIPASKEELAGASGIWLKPRELAPESTAAADEGDCDAVANASRAAGGDAGERVADVEVRVEELRELEKLLQGIAELRGKPRDAFDRFATAGARAWKIEGGGESGWAGEAHAGALLSDIEKRIPKVTRVAQLPEKALAGVASESLPPMFIGTMGEIKASRDNVLELAQNFGLHGAASRAGQFFTDDEKTKFAIVGYSISRLFAVLSAESFVRGQRTWNYAPQATPVRAQWEASPSCRFGFGPHDQTPRSSRSQREQLQAIRERLLLEEDEAPLVQAETPHQDRRDPLTHPQVPRQGASHPHSLPRLANTSPLALGLTRQPGSRPPSSAGDPQVVKWRHCLSSGLSSDFREEQAYDDEFIGLYAEAEDFRMQTPPPSQRAAQLARLSASFPQNDGLYGGQAPEEISVPEDCGFLPSAAKSPLFEGLRVDSALPLPGTRRPRGKHVLADPKPGNETETTACTSNDQKDPAERPRQEPSLFGLLDSLLGV
ncbi:unnamed protein product [Prorocentrum cordatum]|uniref:Tudor domain-containing protein n=1 Tax=Prorocentrum cordatum TaxID=2364126 RepID=A0ABN9RT35_9DINO|nr:unnamed protein product [Polarella glacialis]